MFHNIIITMHKFFSQLLDLIYKKKCYFCSKSKENTKMCTSCYKKIAFLPSKPLRFIDNVQIYCATVYANNAKKMIRAIKYHNQKELAHYQAKLMYDYWQTLDIKDNEYIIVPIPLHKSREKKRKYNHMLLIAREFSEMSGYSIANDLMTRIKDTKPQYKLNQQQREKNMYEAFCIDSKNSEKYKDKNLLIIDDIYTTGTTLREAINTLNAKDFNNITCFTTSCSELNFALF